MSQESTEFINDLIDDGDILDEYYDPNNYDPDEFYKNAVEHISSLSYPWKAEYIFEETEDEREEFVEDHLEVIGEFSDEMAEEPEPIYLRFILYDGRNGESYPLIEKVNSGREFAVKPKENA